MVKSNIDFRKDSGEDIELLLKCWWPICNLREFRILRGGYSGTNYFVRTDGDDFAVLKIMNGYESLDVINQCKIMTFLHQQRYPFSCFPYFSDKLKSFVVLTKDSQPCILLSFVEGTNGDTVAESGLVSLPSLLESVGYNLAGLHSVSSKSSSTDDIIQSPSISITDTDSSQIHSESSDLLSYLDGGCCLIGKHISQSILLQLQLSSSTDPYISSHPYLAFYDSRLPPLIHDLQTEGLPQGILHGDPFLDNVLVDPKDGSFKAFVDFEDTCVGPLLFDIACCIAGSCFEDSGALDISRLEALLSGYFRGRKDSGNSMSASEINLLFPFVKHALLCNTTWRFLNFNITYPEQREENGDRFIELQKRLQGLETLESESAFNEVVDTVVSQHCRSV